MIIVRNKMKNGTSSKFIKYLNSVLILLSVAHLLFV